MRIDKLIAAVGLAGLVAGCATTEPRPGMTQVIEKDDGSRMVVITGSRIPQPEERGKGGSAPTIYPLYIVDREEMWNTGATSVGEALGHLPFVEVQ